ncbi:MAG: hypothetical protein SGPRY_004447, partial [Prymnesium sp.]
QTRMGPSVATTIIPTDASIALGMVLGLLTSEETSETASKPEVAHRVMERSNGTSGWDTPTLSAERT